jgi:lysophospholipase L1-like esterase
MIIARGKKLVMIGDSITDCGRQRPVGEGFGEALGRSYAALIDALLKSAYPMSRIRVVNMGISGNTVRDLKNRWRADVLDLKPDWVSILIGVNDVWRQFDSPLRPEEHVYLEEYEATLEELARLTQKEVEGIILMTPYYMEPNPGDPMRKIMDSYGEAVKRTAGKQGCILVDLQKKFDDYLRYYSAQTINPDRVHPDMVGHTIIARAFLDAVGFEWNCPGQGKP